MLFAAQAKTVLLKPYGLPGTWKNKQLAMLKIDIALFNTRIIQLHERKSVDLHYDTGYRQDLQ